MSDRVIAGQASRDVLGTSEMAWRCWGGLAGLPVGRPQDWASAAVIAAHPEDSVLGVGGTIAALAAAGARLRLVVVAASQTCLPGLPSVTRPAANAAARALGLEPADVICLECPGAGAVRHEAEITAVLSELTSGFEICLAPWMYDADPAHAVVGRSARGAGHHVLSYPMDMWEWALPGDPRVPWDSGVQVPLPARAAARKFQAIHCLADPLLQRRAGRRSRLAPDLIPHFTRAEELLFG
jgi:LmbE family N-acetylglucosaminyl deacetylase